MPGDRSVEAYLARLPEPRAGRGRALHALVLKLFPQAVVSLDYRMPTYRVGENFLAWASQKQYFSVYTCSTERIAAFKHKRPDVRSGVGCLNFRDRDVFAAADLRLVVKDALAPGKALLERERAVRANARRKRS